MLLSHGWQRACLALSLSIGALEQPVTIAAARTPGSTPGPPGVWRTEVQHGAADIAAITARKHPYGAAYRLMRACVEKHVQARQASDAYLVGAHLTIALWVADLPNDTSWREKAFARHRDVAEWLLPHVAGPTREVARIVVRAAGLPTSAEQRLLEFVGQQ